MSSGRLTGRVALITGGGGAIGRATALAMAAEGARVLVADRDLAAADDAVAEIAVAGGDAIAHACDVGDPAGAQSAVDRAVAQWQALDVVFNNAGISPPPAPIEELSVETFDEAVRVNLRGVFLVLAAAIRAMRDGGRPGAIVNMASSMAGWDVLSGEAPYIATKHGVVGLTRSAALDAARFGIRVNAVCPGVIQTRLGIPDLADNGSAGLDRFAARIPLRRVGHGEDVAAVVVFLSCDDSRHVSGASWLIDGGQTLQSWSNAPADDAYESFRHADQGRQP
jgi:NAD(P)-dependent dehydrogenase (short-subunit alcohol dehydrogenase family)